MFRFIASIIALLTPSLALAHTGHGHIDAASIWHWLLEFEHIGWLVPGLVLVVLMWRVLSVKSANRRRQ